MHKVELPYLGTGEHDHIEAMVTTAKNRRITKNNLIKKFTEVYLALDELIDAATSVDKDTSVLMETYRSKSVICQRAWEAAFYTEYPRQLDDTIVYSTINGVYVEAHHSSDATKLHEAYTRETFAKSLVETELDALKHLPQGELIPTVLWFKKNTDKVIAREIPIEPLDEMFSHLTRGTSLGIKEFLENPEEAWNTQGKNIIFYAYNACKRRAPGEVTPSWLVDVWLTSPCKPSYEKYPQ